MSDYAVHLLIFVFGLTIGSFLNVCIFRIPESKSIVRPGSTCPGCNKPIKYYDNIPVISYILLGGKCRKCNMPISFRYPLVELISGLAALAVFMRYGLSFEGLVYFTFISALIVITFIDIDHRIIPDVISLPGIPIGFLASFLLSSITWKGSLIGIIAGGGSLLAVAWIYSLITKNEGMGGGDIKLLAMIGAFIGLKGVIFTVFTASATGTAAGIAAMLKNREGDMKLAVPFGPFLSIGAILYIFFGSEIISWYLNLLI
jgi:leader peptidase (prepilin peptidase)/N-methyltransferase